MSYAGNGGQIGFVICHAARALGTLVAKGAGKSL